MPTYPPDEFLSRLASGALPVAQPPALHGLAQPNDADPATLLFSGSPGCTEWIAVPLSLLDSVEHLRDVTCGDHRHPLVKLTLRAPDGVGAEVPALLRLLAQARATVARLGAAASRSRAGALTAAAARLRPPPQSQTVADGCEYVEFDGEVWVCCCTDGQCQCTGIA